jgi:hypothetical protein
LTKAISSREEEMTGEQESKGAATFIVRMWEEEGKLWRGQIEHVQSGEGIYFQEFEKIIEFIRAKIWRGGDE